MDVPASTTVLPVQPTLTLSAQPRQRFGRPTAAPHLSVVIVNYHNWQDTQTLVDHLRRSPPLRNNSTEIVIVDNNSPLDPVLPHLRRLSGVSLRRWRRNRGFARAVNEGCRLSQGEWLLLLNPDITPDPGFLEGVLAGADELAQADPTVGIIGYRLRHEDGSPQLSTGRFPTLGGTLARLLLPRHRRKYTPPATPTVPTRVDWATGCCLLIRRSCWDDLDGFDPSYFLYYEDVDLCQRAKARGWSVWFDPRQAVTHHRPLHGRAIPAHLRLITRHALLTYARKHWPGWQARALARIVLAEAVARRCLGFVKGDQEAARCFAELQALAQTNARGQVPTLRSLYRLVWQREETRASISVDRHSQSQAA